MGILNVFRIPLVVMLATFLVTSCDERVEGVNSVFPSGAGSGGTQEGFGAAGRGGTQPGFLVVPGGVGAIGQLCDQFCEFVASCEDDPGDCAGVCRCIGIVPDGADLVQEFLDQEFSNCEEADYWQETYFFPGITRIYEQKVQDSESPDDWEWEPAATPEGQKYAACVESVQEADIDI